MSDVLDGLQQAVTTVSWLFQLVVYVVAAAMLMYVGRWIWSAAIVLCRVVGVAARVAPSTDQLRRVVRRGLEALQAVDVVHERDWVRVAIMVTALIVLYVWMRVDATGLLQYLLMVLGAAHIYTILREQLSVVRPCVKESLYNRGGKNNNARLV